MNLSQVRCFLALAETLNFTEASQRCGVSQPSLTRAIQRLEEELGGQLVYRDGKHSRLTPLGRDVHAEFVRIETALANVREHSQNSALGRRRVLDIAVATTVTPLAFSSFFTTVLEQLPSLEINIHLLRSGEGIETLLSGRYHALILPRAPQANHKLTILPLFRERLMLACAEGHALAKWKEIDAVAIASWPYIDRLACEFHEEVTEHFMRRDAVMYPRFRSEREDWVQHMVASGRAICVMPERSAELAGLAVRPVQDMALERQVVLVSISGSGTPTELRQIVELAKRHDWDAVHGR